MAASSRLGQYANLRRCLLLVAELWVGFRFEATAEKLHLEIVIMIMRAKETK